MKIQKFLKTIWNEFVYGGHLISLGAVSVVFTSSILLNINITWDSLLVTYLGCQIIYLYNRYKEFNIDFLTNPERTKHTEKYIRYIPLIIFIFSLLAIGILIYFEKFHALIFGFFLVFLGLLYSLFLKKLTKKIIGFKNFFVTLIWASLVIFLAFYYNFFPLQALILIFIFISIREFINTSFSDIKDIESDKKEGLLTLANILGKEKLIKILSILNIAALIPIITGLYLEIFPKSSIFLFLTTFYVFYYFKKSKDKKVKNAYLYNFLVEGEFPLWSFFILLGEFLL